MDDRTISLYLSRILSGFYIFIYNNKKYKLVYPDINLKYEADFYVQEEYDRLKYNDWINEDELVVHLVDLGLWDFNGDVRLKALETQIEDTKIELYKSFLDPKKVKALKKHLAGLDRKYNQLYADKHALDHITLNGYCNKIKNYFLLSRSIFDMDNNRIFNDNNTNIRLLDDISGHILVNNIETSTFKKIARSNIWRNYWGANQNNLFGRPTVDWTDEQKTLVVISKMYDSVYEHPESPSEEVIEDDDMLDGWMILKRRENEKHKNQKRTEEMLPKSMQNAQEVFIVGKSQKEVQNIYSLNDHQGRGVIKERKEILKKSGTVKEQHLPDVQRDILTMSNEQRKQRR